MTPLVPIALLGWIPVTLVLFSLLPARRAVIVALIAGWLLLPVATYALPGFPDYNKVTATTLSAFLAGLVFDGRRFLKWRLRWYDAPIIVWCLVPMASSLSNGLGPYDGLAATFSQVVRWGLPYLLGRVYFSDAEGMRELAIGIIAGGMLYVPLCWIEIRLSPQLHTWIYGFHQHQFAQTKRFGGFRPVVFLQHGLAVGMWMTAACLAGFWMHWSGRVKRTFGVPMALLVPLLLLTAIFSKSTGALALLAIGVGVLCFSRWTRTRFALLAMIVIPVAYVVSRGTGMWDARELVDLVRAVVGDARASSLEFRLENENRLVSHALVRPMLGWAGWGRNLVPGSVTDGLWVIALGLNGLVGLAAAFGTHMIGGLLYLTKRPGRGWSASDLAGAEVMSLLLSLYVIDFLFNGMVNPVFTMTAGGLPALAVSQLRSRGPVAASIRAAPTLRPPRRSVRGTT